MSPFANLKTKAVSDRFGQNFETSGKQPMKVFVEFEDTALTIVQISLRNFANESDRDIPQQLQVSRTNQHRHPFFPLLLSPIEFSFFFDVTYK